LLLNPSKPRDTDMPARRRRGSSSSRRSAGLGTTTHASSTCGESRAGRSISLAASALACAPADAARDWCPRASKQEALAYRGGQLGALDRRPNPAARLPTSTNPAGLASATVNHHGE